MTKVGTHSGWLIIHYNRILKKLLEMMTKWCVCCEKKISENTRSRSSSLCLVEHKKKFVDCCCTHLIELHPDFLVLYVLRHKCLIIVRCHCMCWLMECYVKLELLSFQGKGNTFMHFKCCMRERDGNSVLSPSNNN